jgi:peptide chain release factor 2
LFVYPEIDESIEIDVNPADVRVDTYRASGAGGQHINKTDSAVRLTHTPSGIVVQCQNDRSQHRNRAEAWAMLMRQYLRYCERKGFKTEILEESEGDVAGIKTASIKVEGDYAYGFLRTETGVHRLVRKSPFDSAGGRHTSFSSLFVYPEIDESIEIDVNPADVRVDTYRASGAGGQHINKTDSAVRLTHTPSGIVVQCQNDRSQHRNRAEAWAMLKSRLYELELRKRMSEQQKLEDSKTDIGWGHQIRSYVLDQSRIKDLRTNFETGNTKAVLDGDLDEFIAASLKQGV